MKSLFGAKDQQYHVYRRIVKLTLS